MVKLTDEITIIEKDKSINFKCNEKLKKEFEEKILSVGYSGFSDFFREIMRTVVYGDRNKEIFEKLPQLRNNGE